MDKTASRSFDRVFRIIGKEAFQAGLETNLFDLDTKLVTVLLGDETRLVGSVWDFFGALPANAPYNSNESGHGNVTYT